MGTRLALHEVMQKLLSLRGSYINTADGWIWDPFNFNEDYIDTSEEPNVVRTTAVHVYYQPPETVKMKYPCIVYEPATEWTIYANNNPYAHKSRFTITVIDRNIESEIPGKVSDLPTARMNRYFAANNLHHWVYDLYY